MTGRFTVPAVVVIVTMPEYVPAVRFAPFILRLTTPGVPVIVVMSQFGPTVEDVTPVIVAAVPLKVTVTLWGVAPDPGIGMLKSTGFGETPGLLNSYRLQP